MAARHIRTSSLVSQHKRSSSTSSEILITETVSSLQRCVFGNVFRSQRQLTRFGIFLTLFVLAVYMLGPFGSSSKAASDPDPKPKANAAVRSIGDEENPSSEYRATYFEEMGKRFAEKKWQVKVDPFHSNNILAPEVKEEGQGSETQGDLNAVVEKVREAARIVSRCKEVPGLSVVMVKGGYATHIPFGLADVSTGRPVTMETRFLLNSISKTFLGQVLGILISEAGRNLTWDTRVVDILGPEFQLATEELTREVTLRDLMSHQTGLSSGNLAVRATYPEGWTRAQLVKNLKYLPPSTPFRKSFLYSNMGGMLATHVAETLGGAPWEKLVVDKLLTPLGMLSSRPITTLEGLEAEDLSRLYVPVEGRLTQADSRIFNQGPLSSVALLSTSAKDITKWMQFNLRQGRLEDGRPLIRRDLWVPMWTKQVELSPMFLAGVDKSGSEWPVKDISEGYGLGWFINRYRGLTNLWHGGGLYSHYALAWHFPEKDVALYTVINGYSGDSRPFSIVESLSYYAADLLLGYQPWLDNSSLCTFPKLSSMPGTWQNQSEGGSPGNKVPGRERDGDERNQGLEKGGERAGKFASNFLQFAAEGKAGLNAKSGDPAAVNLAKNIGVLKDHHADNRQGKDRSEPQQEMESDQSALPLKRYEGLYHSPLFGNFSVFFNPVSAQLQCRMNVLTGLLRHAQGHVFSIELTQSLRFLSKPSKTAAARPAFRVTFVESERGGEVTAVDVHSSWAMEVPLRFQRIR